MSASLIEPLDDLSGGMGDPTNPEHLAFHKTRSKDKKALHAERSWSNLWLEENGFVPSPKAKQPKPRKSESKPISQGNPPADILPIRGIEGKRVVEADFRNLAAELTFLAWVIERPKLLAELVDQINPEDFAGDAHRVLISEILTRFRKGQKIDPVALGEDLSRDILFVEAGGGEVLANLSTAKTKSSDPNELLKIIHSHATRRELFVMARELQRAVVEGDLNEDQILSQTRVRIETIEAPLTNGWELPLLSDNASAMAFPIDVLPERAKQLCAEAARINYFPPEFLAVPLFPTAGAAIGRTVCLKLKEEWYEYPSIYSFIVGTPGSGKSTGISRLAAKPILKLSRQLRSRHRTNLAAYEEACRAAAADRKAVQQLAPKAKRIDVDDITREKLVPMLADNPRGLLAIHDEMSDWLKGMNQYKGGAGNDQEIFLKIFSGVRVTVDRVSQSDGQAIVADHPFLCISGGIQPAVLPSLSNNGIDNGFLDRWLVSYPDEMEPGFSMESVDKGLMHDWCRVFERLWNRNPYFGHDDKPFEVQFTAKALQKYTDWAVADCKSTASDESQKDFAGPWIKYRSYVVRLALILDQMHWAYNEKSTDKMRSVGLEALAGAIELINYFKAHFRHVYGKIHGRRASDNKLAVNLLSWLMKREGQPTKFRKSEASDNFRKHLAEWPEDLDIALRWLVERRCIRLIPAPSRSRGRTPGPVYEINPHLFSQNRAPNAFNSQPIAK